MAQMIQRGKELIRINPQKIALSTLLTKGEHGIPDILEVWRVPLLTSWTLEQKF